MAKRANDPADEEPEIFGIAHMQGQSFGKGDPRYPAARQLLPTYAVLVWPPAYARWVGRCTAAEPNFAEMSFGLPSRWPDMWRRWLCRLVEGEEGDVQLVGGQLGWSLRLVR
jgi:hypothetical protein